MGRVAKYKKIKAFDPFSKQNNGKGLDFIWGFGNDGTKVKKRSRTAEKLHQQKMARRLKRLNATAMNPANKKTLTGVDRSLNAPPSDIKDEFDLNDIQATLVPQKDESHTLLLTEAIPTVSAAAATAATTAASDKPVSDTATATVSVPKVHMDAEKEIKQAEKILKLDDTITPKFEGRREHESKNAYNKRVKSETRQIIQRQARNALNPEKRKRKKEFLNNRGRMTTTTTMMIARQGKIMSPLDIKSNDHLPSTLCQEVLLPRNLARPIASIATPRSKRATIHNRIFKRNKTTSRK
jgi:hypothetical protein